MIVIGWVAAGIIIVLCSVGGIPSIIVGMSVIRGNLLAENGRRVLSGDKAVFWGAILATFGFLMILFAAMVGTIAFATFSN